MNPQILAALITAGLTVSAGIVGYFFRQYRQRARPFVAVTGMAGDFRAGSTVVDIDQELVDSINSTVFINKLSPRDTLDEVWESRNTAEQARDRLPELSERISHALAAAKAKDSIVLQTSLAKMFGSMTAQKVLLLLFATDRIKTPAFDDSLETAISILDSNDRGGSVWVDFPGEATQIGIAFERAPIIRKKLQPLFELIKRLDFIGLEKVLISLDEEVTQLVNISEDVVVPLETMLDTNAQWGIQLFVANLGSTPFLIRPEATLHVADGTGAKYQESCHLVNLSTDSDNKVRRQKAITPLVLGSEKDMQFAFFTNRTQREMVRGTAFRDAYASGQATCWLSFTIEQAGIKRLREIESPRAPFRDSE